jgi:hypothetical protein
MNIIVYARTRMYKTQNPDRKIHSHVVDTQYGILTRYSST